MPKMYRVRVYDANGNDYAEYPIKASNVKEAHSKARSKLLKDFSFQMLFMTKTSRSRRLRR
jgi:hypothetical protein